jgi:2-dehydropantoate 2-reductase
MKIAILGAGGVGGYFGARLAESGQDVTFVARGAHLDAMRSNGLRVLSPKGDAHLENVNATDDPAGVGTVEVIIVAVKAWQLDDAIASMKPMVGTETVVLPLLNGVEAPSRLATAFGRERVLGGLCGILAHIERPGVIRHAGPEPRIVLGELDNKRSVRIERLLRALLDAGVHTEVPPDIDAALWRKFMFIAPASGVGAVTRAPYGVMLDVPEVRDLLTRAVRETLAVGQATGIALNGADVDAVLGLFAIVPADGLTSMQRDIQNGRPSELDAQTGAIVRLAAKCGTAAPVNEMIYRALLPQELRARGKLSF